MSPTIKEWLELSDWLEKAKPREMELRKKLAAHYFVEPKEGVNKVIIQYAGQPHELVMGYKINRKLDEPALTAVMEKMPTELQQLGVLISYKPQLVLPGFRTLTEGQQLIFADALTETPGAPELELKPAKDAALDPATAPAIADWPATKGGAPATAPTSPAAKSASGTTKKTAAKKAAKATKKKK